MNYIAMDIGGSSIKAAIIDSEGKILDKIAKTTPVTNYEDLLGTLRGIVDWANAKVTLSGIAVSQPCATDAVSGEALSEGALIYIKNTNPAKDLGKYYNLPYAAENDGNCAALGEIWVGSAKNSKDVALVVCGSGIGGAVVIDRQIITGHQKFAGEFGMCVVGEIDGRPVTWSEVGSTTALVRNYAKCTQESMADLNGKLVFERAAQGDMTAQACIDQYFKYFAYGVHNVQHIYDPEVILVGGAISGRPDFIPRLEKSLEALNRISNIMMIRPKVLICALGADANMIGAVYHLIKSKQIMP